MPFPRIYIYRPDRGWRKNIFRDCLYDLKDRQIDAPKPESQEKKVLPFDRKDYQVEANHP